MAYLGTTSADVSELSIYGWKGTVELLRYEGDNICITTTARVNNSFNGLSKNKATLRLSRGLQSRSLHLKRPRITLRSLFSRAQGDQNSVIDSVITGDLVQDDKVTTITREGDPLAPPSPDPSVLRVYLPYDCPLEEV